VAIHLCSNTECRRMDGQRAYFGADRWEPYCSLECRRATEARLTRVPCSAPTTIMRNRPAPPTRRTHSLTEGFLALAGQTMSPDESARRNDEREADMLQRLVSGPRRPARTSQRD
jgi:hypothetical protein